MSDSKKTVAVFFGGKSPEHDVSVVTGLQVYGAIDASRYNTFPVYVALDGRWYIGDALKERESFIPGPAVMQTLTEVVLDVSGDGQAVLLPRHRPFFGRGISPHPFDVAIPAFHGLFGEDGRIQGLFETANVAYTGMRTMASSLLMDKGMTKHVLNSLGIPALPSVMVKRPSGSYVVDKVALEALMGNIGFPCIVKPCNLGSSIGVARANNVEEVQAALPGVFQFDCEAIIEPFVPNLVEYNVSVSMAFGSVTTSAIERPKATEELLDFKQKYLSGADGKTGTKTGSKTPGAISQGMLSLTRELNPDISKDMEDKLRDWSARLFVALNGSGAPRIDYLCNGETGELWLNEVNPCPGSFGYFLWEAAEKQVLFTPFLTYLIEEALELQKQIQLPSDPVPADARLFKRP